MGMFKEFREFAIKGSVVDLAVGVIIGAAFGKIVTSLVEDVIMPPLGMAIGNIDFANLFVDLSGTGHRTLADAKEAGAATINYGLFLNNVLQFLILAFIIFLIIRAVNRWRRRGEGTPPPATKECPYCLTMIPIKATKCASCTTLLGTGVAPV